MKDLLPIFNSLNDCQLEAMEALLSSDNVFLTGQAGTGKSYLLGQYRERSNRNPTVVSSTGASAILINGRTFHSFFGIGVMEGGHERTVIRASENYILTERLRAVHEVIIDEVSMLSGQTLCCAEEICRKARNSKEPWGGIRIIAVGDFFQLPPVTKDRNQDIDWAFTHPVWERSKFTAKLLKTIMRTNDEKFLEVLNHIRSGEINDNVKKYLNSRHISGTMDEFRGVRLYGLIKDVESYNQKRLGELKSPLNIFPTKYTGDNDNQIKTIKKACPIPETLHLKIGAYVMIRVNKGEEYVNGTTGYITDIGEKILTIQTDKGKFFLEQYAWNLLNGDGIVTATATNFPVTLAWAMTIHKAQGTTLKEALLDLSNLWDSGQAYVAVSRLSSGDGLKIKSWNQRSFRIDQKVKSFYEKLKA